MRALAAYLTGTSSGVGCRETHIAAFVFASPEPFCTQTDVKSKETAVRNASILPVTTLLHARAMMWRACVLRSRRRVMRKLSSKVRTYASMSSQNYIKDKITLKWLRFTSNIDFRWLHYTFAPNCSRRRFWFVINLSIDRFWIYMVILFYLLRLSLEYQCAIETK